MIQPEKTVTVAVEPVIGRFVQKAKTAPFGYAQNGVVLVLKPR